MCHREQLLHDEKRSTDVKCMYLMDHWQMQFLFLQDPLGSIAYPLRQAGLGNYIFQIPWWQWILLLSSQTLWIPCFCKQTLCFLTPINWASRHFKKKSDGFKFWGWGESKFLPTCFPVAVACILKKRRRLWALWYREPTFHLFLFAIKSKWTN